MNINTLLDGKEIAQYLGVKPGKIVGEIKEQMLHWQIENYKQNLSRADAERWLQSRSSKKQKLSHT